MSGTQQSARQLPDTAGYQALGDLMGNFPEIAIFRRYRSAGALDLLYLQASLHRAIKKWAGSFNRDKSNPQRSKFDFTFRRLQDSDGPDAAIDVGEQWREWCEISEKLDLYYEKMLRFQKICSLAKVDKFQLRSLRHFLSNPEGGDRFLEDIEEDLYDGADDVLNDEDLISIAHADEPDWFTELARGRISSTYHILTRGNRSGRTVRAPRLTHTGHRDYRLIEHSDESIQKTSRTMYALLTSALIVLAIFTLNWFDGFGVRVSLILVHNLLFTLGMAFLTHVKPVELFAASAAYAAVLVVFASGSFGLRGSANSS